LWQFPTGWERVVLQLAARSRNGRPIEDFIRLTKTVRAIADQYANGRVLSLLEGGYNPPRLAECVEVHLEELLAK
jgi:acetoin utilization deacetylase AcuC-like enzyme